MVQNRYPRYKRWTAAAVVLMAGLWIAYLLLWPDSVADATAGVPVGAPAPDFALKTLDNQSYKLADLRGKAVLINFFTTWCPPCRAEAPTLQAAFKEYESRGFVVLAINLDESNVTVRSFREKLGLTFPIVIDKDDRVTRSYGIIPLPTSYLVDRSGVVWASWAGAVSKEQLASMLVKVLSGAMPDE